MKASSFLVSGIRAALVASALVCAQGAIASSATLDKIKATGAVTMGVRESSIPMSYTTGDSRFDGFHVEVCRMILNDIKAKLGLSTLRINYQPVTAQNRIPLVQNGTVDIECGTTTNNTARQRDVSFANTLYVEEVRIAVKANSGINSISQLAGKKVATTTALHPFRFCVGMKKQPALTLMKYLVKTMLIVSYCWSLAVQMPL